MTDARPFAQEDLDTLFAPFKAFERVLLAVSGGSDSLALLYLTKEWAERLTVNAPRFEVATVDHGLRMGSRAEALEVQRHAEQCGFVHHLLEWTGPKPPQALQARARAMRYALMEQVASGWTEEHVALATAHTCEDQAETVLMRLARGSGPDGLRGISSKRPLVVGSRICLLRPLLRVARSDLQSWLSARGLQWLDDPSNQDARFERVHFRQAEPTLRSLGLHPDKLALSAERQARAVAALEEATTQLQASCLHLHGGAYARLDRATFARAPQELRVRLLARVLHLFRGESPQAGLDQIERLVTALEQHSSLRQTLGGCEIHARRGELLLYREVGRASLTPMPLKPGVPVLWDQRFRISLSQTATQKYPAEDWSHVIVRPLDLALFRELRVRGEKKFSIPARAAATLPAVWSGNILLTIGGIREDPILGQLSFSLTDQLIHAEFLNCLEDRVDNKGLLSRDLS